MLQGNQEKDPRQGKGTQVLNYVWDYWYWKGWAKERRGHKKCSASGSRKRYTHPMWMRGSVCFVTMQKKGITRAFLDAWFCFFVRFAKGSRQQKTRWVCLFANKKVNSPFLMFRVCLLLCDAKKLSKGTRVCIGVKKAYTRPSWCWGLFQCLQRDKKKVHFAKGKEKGIRVRLDVGVICSYVLQRSPEKDTRARLDSELVCLLCTGVNKKALIS